MSDKALSPLEPLLADHIREARKTLSIYCRTREELCRGYLEVASRIGRTLAAVRLAGLQRSKEYSGIDAGLFGALRGVEDVYALYLAGLLVTYGEKVLVKVKGCVELEGARLEKGDLAILSLERAALLLSLGLAEPLQSLAAEL